MKLGRWIVILTLLASSAAHAAPVIEVWRSAYCDCCKEWVKHLQANGFSVRDRVVDDPTAQRKALGMPDDLGGCHSARVAGYVIEGHVPAREIHRLLKEKPAALGLSVPGMPLGSPGMEGPRADRYAVLLVSRDGRHRVYQQY